MNGVRAFGAESSAYQSGADDARRAADHATRVAAFGAIRRAATIARENDRDWETMRDPAASAAAYDVRRAIRAAIGSDKA